MKDFRIDTGLLGDIADGLRRGGSTLGSSPEVIAPDAGELSGALAAALSTVHGSAAIIAAALSAIADGVAKTASMAAATDRESAAMFEGLPWD